jgi:hypothetical protein
MTKYVYVVHQIDCEPWESFHDGVHKVFSTEESAQAYIEENKEKIFPENRDPSEDGWAICSDVQTIVLED